MKILGMECDSDVAFTTGVVPPLSKDIDGVQQLPKQCKIWVGNKRFMRTISSFVLS